MIADVSNRSGLQGSSSPRRMNTVPGSLALEDKSTRLHRNVGKHYLSDTPPRDRRPEKSTSCLALHSSVSNFYI